MEQCWQYYKAAYRAVVVVVVVVARKSSAPIEILEFVYIPSATSFPSLRAINNLVHSIEGYHRHHRHHDETFAPLFAILLRTNRCSPGRVSTSSPKQERLLDQTY